MEYDNTLWSIVAEETNTALMSDDRAWMQATLPLKLGGLGVCSAVEVASFAYLALLHATFTIVEAIFLINMSFSTPFLLVMPLHAGQKVMISDLCMGMMLTSKSPGIS